MKAVIAALAIVSLIGSAQLLLLALLVLGRNVRRDWTILLMLVLVLSAWGVIAAR